MKKKLVVVESPTKVKTISKYLGSNYIVMSSVGHVRDLFDPKDLPPEKKTGSIAKFSVDVDANFAPFYSVIKGKKKVIDGIKKELKDATELILATDEDREGEAIAWHLLEVLKPKVPVRRMVFHEITQSAINFALQNTREIDANLVDAQEARRIFDRLYGYEISPVLWRKVGAGTSAGRVQSVATRLIVDKEKDRINFTTSNYFSITANISPLNASQSNSIDFELFSFKFAKGTRKAAQGRDFDSDGKLVDPSAFIIEKDVADKVVERLKGGKAKVASVESKPYTRKPNAPFTTSTLQQDASSKLGFSARKTMSIAQSLYENGFITYMRTDSVLLSQEAVKAAKESVTHLFGKDAVERKERVWTTKTKNAQEAHEAIRPSGAKFCHPADLPATLNQTEIKLYDLIYKRTLSCFMKDATGRTTTIEAEADCPIAVEGEDAMRAVILRASGTEITDPGFLQLYQENETNSLCNFAQLKNIKKGDLLLIQNVSHISHATKPPARYSEASIIKKLDELGIGRPSTYAQTISTIEDRGYITRRGTALVPSWRAFCVIKLLERHCLELIEYNFTAKMEEDLDKIAEGSKEKSLWLHALYFGSQNHPGLRAVFDSIGDIDARDINSFSITPSITLRVGRFGIYLEEATSTKRANVPDTYAPDELTPQLAREILDSGSDQDRYIGKSINGSDIIVKSGRFGPYVVEQDTSGKVLKTSSLFKSMSVGDLTLKQAQDLLSLPRIVGVEPSTNVEIFALNGRYGPYIKMGKETRTLAQEEELLSISLSQAIELFKAPKARANRTASSILRDFALDDPVSGKPVKIKNGRFGMYVTDGTTNATLPKSIDAEDLSFEQAVAMLEEKRQKQPANPSSTRKKPAKPAKSAKSTSSASARSATSAKSTSTKPTKPAKSAKNPQS